MSQSCRTDATPTDAPPPKRRPGRPRGSKNKIGRDSKQLLEKAAPSALKALAKLAAGQVVRVKDRDATERVLTPTVGEMLQAQRLVLDKLLPSLRAPSRPIKPFTPAPRSWPSSAGLL